MTHHRFFLLAVAAVAAISVPAVAQMSDAYNFLKSVRERDAAAVERILASAGSTTVNARDSGTGQGAIHMVVRARDAGWLSLLLARGARVDLTDNEGNSALNTAAQLGWSEGVARLLRSGAGVNLANSRGETPLIAAVQRRDIPSVRMLLNAGANPNHTDSVAGLSAIDYARRDSRSAEIARLLQAPRTPARPVSGPSR